MMRGLRYTPQGQVSPLCSSCWTDPGASHDASRGCCRLRKVDSAGPPDVILDLESPLKPSRRARSLHQAGTAVLQDTTAFAGEGEPATPTGAKPQFPVRAQAGPCSKTLEPTKP